MKGTLQYFVKFGRVNYQNWSLVCNSKKLRGQMWQILKLKFLKVYFLLYYYNYISYSVFTKLEYKWDACNHRTSSILRHKLKKTHVNDNNSDTRETSGNSRNHGCPRSFSLFEWTKTSIQTDIWYENTLHNFFIDPWGLNTKRLQLNHTTSLTAKLSRRQNIPITIYSHLQNIRET